MTNTANHQSEAQRAFIVCPTCQGEGQIGPGHVYTQADRDEFDPQDFDDLMSDYRAGVYNVRCDECGGQRVVRAECPCADCEEGRRDLAEMYAIERAERAFGC